jgi:hypothetical protein
MMALYQMPKPTIYMYDKEKSCWTVFEEKIMSYSEKDDITLVDTEWAFAGKLVDTEWA